MSDLTDKVGNANLYNGISYSFVEDRFNNPNSAIYFNSGKLKVPSGVYFSGDFTFIAWIKIKYYVVYGRIFDFGNGFASDNIGFGLINGTKLNTFTLSSSRQLSLTNSAFVINFNGLLFMLNLLFKTIYCKFFCVSKPPVYLCHYVSWMMK